MDAKGVAACVQTQKPSTVLLKAKKKKIEKGKKKKQFQRELPLHSFL